MRTTHHPAVLNTTSDDELINMRDEKPWSNPRADG